MDQMHKFPIAHYNSIMIAVQTNFELAYRGQTIRVHFWNCSVENAIISYLQNWLISVYMKNFHADSYWLQGRTKGTSKHSSFLIAVVLPEGYMWVHMHPVHIPVHPLLWCSPTCSSRTSNCNPIMSTCMYSLLYHQSQQQVRVLA